MIVPHTHTPLLLLLVPLPQVAGARADALASNWQSATGKLRRALAIDGSFGYTEPPRQYQPLKPCLGWLLLQQGRLGEAERVSCCREGLCSDM
jgi:hypothetical protein